MGLLRAALLLVVSAVAACGSPALGADPDPDLGPDAGGAPDTPGAPDAPPPSCVGRWPSDLQLGTALDDELLGLTLDDRDDLIIAGFDGGTNGVTNIEPDGDARGYVASYTPAGTLRWRTPIDTAGTDTIEDVAVDARTGAIVFVGRTSGAFTGFANQGQFDAIAGELDADGRLSTLVQVGDERPQHPARLSLGPDGMIGVAGWDDTYVPSNYVAAWQDGFVARFDRGATAGAPPTQAWARYADPVHFNTIPAIAVDPGGSGAMYATGDSGRAIFVEKLAADGSIKWRTTLSPFGLDAANAIALAPSGALYVTGGTNLVLGARSFGQEDAFVARIDPATGAIAWIAQAGGAGPDYPTAIAVDASEHVVIAGITLGSVVDGVANQGGMDLFAMRFDASGAQDAAWQRGTSADDWASAVVVDRCGHVLVGGWTGGAMVAGVTPAGRADAFVIDVARGDH